MSKHARFVAPGWTDGSDLRRSALTLSGEPVSQHDGILVDRLDLSRPGKQVLGSGPYEYFHYLTNRSEEITFEGELGSFSVYLYRKARESTVTVKADWGTLDEGDCIQVEGERLRMSVRGGAAQFLVAGTVHQNPNSSGLHLTRHAELYRVHKPWGHELWINGQHPGYAFKQIFIKAGTKTSLQYHRLKQETNVLVQGTAWLHYRVNETVPNDRVTPADIGTLRVEPVTAIGVRPPTLHRLEAMTDILLYESSTPHLDDVVRVHDDSRRPDGRIDAEHRR